VLGRLDGKVAIITGAARGQGEAHARAFVSEGARVVLGDVLDDRAAGVASGLGNSAVAVHLDVRDEARWAAAVDTAIARFGRLDVLVNNAGILLRGALADTTLAAYREVIDVNQVGCFLGMRAVVPTMAAAGGGSIVNTSSVVGLEGGSGVFAYAASKAAIRSMTESAAIELGPLGIRVNSIHPGGVDTEMVRPAGGELPTAPLARLPLRRLARPEEIAPLAVYLASDESSYCTGGAFVIDGGQTAGNPLH
jgi:3alpha(or 20beta)-hydroxysteroid dehydrogenase